MQKYNSQLKLPKIDDFVSQKGKTSLNSSINSLFKGYPRFQSPSGISSTLNSPAKGGRLYGESPDRTGAESNYSPNQYPNGLTSDKVLLSCYFYSLIYFFRPEATLI